jgi:hypothetical protein
MTRLRGSAPKGERLIDKVPQGKWKTATFLSSVRPKTKYRGGFSLFEKLGRLL